MCVYVLNKCEDKSVNYIQTMDSFTIYPTSLAGVFKTYRLLKDIGIKCKQFGYLNTS